MEKISRVGAIKRYFEADDTQAPGGGRKITMDELRALSAADREELAQMAAKKLGVELADA